MRNRTLVAAALIATLCACSPNTAPSPSGPGPSGSVIESGQPGSSEAAFARLIGPWQAAQLELGVPETAVISDACAAAARAQLGEPEANLPTALVDARGESVATAILADDKRAIDCRVRLDSAGGATVDLIERLAPSLAAPATAEKIALTSLIVVPDRPGDRTLMIGRVGPAASGVKVSLTDGTDVHAAAANGWYAAWWPGHTRPTAIVAVDSQGVAVATVAPPNGAIDGQMVGASWWLDPSFPAATATSTTVHALVLESACASGKSPNGRIEQPFIDLMETTVTVTFGIRPLPGPQDCQRGTAVPLVLQLPEALAGRKLLDGNERPPRDATLSPID